MSYHFSANQFEREFNPKRLGNWEVSKWFPERPRQHLHKTRIIADDRGHLLPGIPRNSENPWEKYITAWDFPRKITRKFAKEVTAPPPRKVSAWTSPQQRKALLPQKSLDSQAEERESRRSGKDQPCAPLAIGPPPQREKPEGSPVGQHDAGTGVQGSSPVTSKSGKREVRRVSPPSTAEKDRKSNSPPSKGAKSPPQSGKEGKKRLEAPADEERPSPPPPSQASGSDPVKTPGKTCGSCPKVGELVDAGQPEEGLSEENLGFSEMPRFTNGGNGTSSPKTGAAAGEEGGLAVTGMAYGRGSTPPGVSHEQKMANGKPGLGDGLSALASAYTPFMVAKQSAEENLRHHPLPDMVEDPSYRLLESQRAKHPGTVLPVPPRAVAVSIRHKAPGPTHCTKSSIFRSIKPPPENPLTAMAPLGGKDEEKVTKTYQPKITDMDLAIGWDIYAPIKKHGQQQALGTAPSVFNVVPPSSPPIGDCGMPGGCGTPSVVGSSNSASQTRGVNAIENAPCSSKQPSPPQTKPPSMQDSKTSSPPFSKIVSPQNSKPHSMQNSKPPTPLSLKTPSVSKPPTPQTGKFSYNGNRGSISSWDLHQRPPPRKAWEEKENNSPNMVGDSQNQFRGTEIRNCMSNNPDQLPKVNNIRKRRSHSSPNLTRNPGSNVGAAFHKSCTACHDNPKPNTSPKNSESSSYKMAFKAGKPTGNRPMTAHPSGSSGITSLASQGDATKVKVPKPRAPFARRSYSIGTLAPPFSLWPGNHKRGGRDYPDHWRLASVYQHAFKPIPNRTRPLLATVYQ